MIADGLSKRGGTRDDHAPNEEWAQMRRPKVGSNSVVRCGDHKREDVR